MVGGSVGAQSENLESWKDRVDALAGAQLWDAAIKECDKSLQLKGNRNLLRTLKLDRAWCLVEAKDYVAANRVFSRHSSRIQTSRRCRDNEQRP